MRAIRSALVVALIVAGSAGSPARAAVVPDHVVLAGALPSDVAQKPYAFTKFYPPTLQIHQGETIRWEFPSIPEHLDKAFHSVGFFPEDQRPAHFESNEIPGIFQGGHGLMYGTGCGRNGDPCVIDDPDEVVTSGAFSYQTNADSSIKPWDATIDLPVGSYEYHCTIHANMNGTIQVVSPETPLANPDAAAIADDIATDTHAADVLFAADSVPTSSLVNGQRIWNVHVGDATADGSALLLAYMPSSLPIAKGDGVHFIVKGEDMHTITFPGPWDAPFSPLFGPSCDPDDPAGGLPDVPLAGIASQGQCPDGWSLEFQYNPIGTTQQRAPLDAVLTPLTVHDSGLVLDATDPESERGMPPGSGTYAPSDFAANFPASGTFQYVCLVHYAWMTGSITVA